MEGKGQQLITCSKCGSNKLRKADSSGTVAGMLLLFGFLIVWIPIVGWILGTLLILGGLAVAILASIPSLNTTKTMQCVECKNRFKVDKEVFKQWLTV